MRPPRLLHCILAQIGEHQGEGRRHAESLRDAQERKSDEVRRDGEQGGRDRQQRKADQDAQSAVDAVAEEGNRHAGNRHAQGAGIDRKTHGGRSDAVSARQ